MKRFFLFFLLLIPVSLFATFDNNIVKSLDEDILILTKNKGFVIYQHGKEKAYYIAVDLDQYKNYNLNFLSIPGTCLFVNEKLVSCNNSDSTIQESISLTKFPLKEGKDVIAFYNKEAHLPPSKLFIGFNSNIPEMGAGLRMFPRNFYPSRDLTVVTFVICMIILAFIRVRFPGISKQTLNLSSIFPDFSPQEDLVPNLFNLGTILLIIFNSLCLAFLIQVIEETRNLREVLLFLNPPHVTKFKDILVLTGIISLAFVLKYFFLAIVSWIFNLSYLLNIQFYELLKIFFKINLVISVLVVAVFSSGYFDITITYNQLFIYLIISLILITLRIAYIIFNTKTYKNLYLFSYLCATEILPLILFVKIF